MNFLDPFSMFGGGGSHKKTAQPATVAPAAAPAPQSPFSNPLVLAGIGAGLVGLVLLVVMLRK